MKKKLLLIILVGLLAGCAESLSLSNTVPPGNSVRQGHELTSYTAITQLSQTMTGESMAFKPDDVEASLPELEELPFPETKKRGRRTNRQFTGIIKNKTNYEVSVPAANSGSTLIIPPKGFIEYAGWGRQFDVTVYYGGKPFYCLKINVQPKNFDYMCKKYDFMVDIVKAEPRKKSTGKMKKAIKRKRAPKNEGAETYG